MSIAHHSWIAKLVYHFTLSSECNCKEVSEGFYFATGGPAVVALRSNASSFPRSPASRESCIQAVLHPGSPVSSESCIQSLGILADHRLCHHHPCDLPLYYQLCGLWGNHYYLVLCFNGHFPGEPGLAGFIGAKDDGGGDENWGYKTCKAPVRSSPPTNQHPTFYRPDALPVAQPTVSEHSRERGRVNH